MPTITLVFSATPYRMGAFIRAVTHAKYNHVSLSLTDGAPLCSFARVYGNVPFCGGFVEESPRRYRHGGRTAEVVVCRVPVSEEGYAAAEALLDTLRRQRERYLYNLFSAAVAPLHRRLVIAESYTCVEFAAAVLAAAGVLTEEEGQRFWTVEGLLARLASARCYEGAFPLREGDDWGGDAFPRRQSFPAACALTCRAIGRLTARAIGRR